MGVTQDDVIRTVALLGERGKQFQSRQVRKQLRVSPTDRNATSRVHNILRSLEREQVIEIVPGDRKRNKYYCVKNDVLLRTAPPVNGSVGTAPAGPQPLGAADRLTRMEALLSSLDQRLAGLDAKVSRLLEIWR